MKKPKVFIIILNYNGESTLGRCLESVYKLNYDNYEVVVVDNNSTDGSFDKMRPLYAKFNFIKNSQNLGFAAGNNVAIKWSLEKMADYVLLLNNDALIEKNSLALMVQAAQAKAQVGIVSPIIYKGESKKIWFAGGKINWFKMRAEHLVGRGKTQYITGCAMLIKKEVFKKIGLLDENFFLYYEDVDFSYRAQKKGFGLEIVSGAKVFHFEKSEESLNKIYYLVISGVRFFRKNSQGVWRFYIEVYLLLRKLKNKWDEYRGNNQEKTKLVKKAYQEIN